MGEKVILPRDVAEALDHAKSTMSNEELIKYHAYDTDSWNNKALPLNGIPLMTLMSALVNGYTVEKSPEDKVREYYDEMESLYKKSSEHEREFYNGSADAIVITLNLLGITIEGINDKKEEL